MKPHYSGRELSATCSIQWLSHSCLAWHRTQPSCLDWESKRRSSPSYQEAGRWAPYQISQQEQQTTLEEHGCSKEHLMAWQDSLVVQASDSIAG